MDMVVVLINKFDEKFVHPQQKGQSKWILSKTIFNMHVVFIDTTDTLLQENLRKNLSVQ